ncbi:hypothetical protein RLOC_00001549 [Lonchura striata]|uniref:Uncharacterized protein n=1 Tax=Lonchura striata TaxID=40157 RepID=A0A218UK93_9PASE|nr:hypothetical protein RLOC_00001549 [Lonchura striata domestica]
MEIPGAPSSPQCLQQDSRDGDKSSVTTLRAERAVLQGAETLQPPDICGKAGVRMETVLPAL